MVLWHRGRWITFRALPHSLRKAQQSFFGRRLAARFAQEWVPVVGPFAFVSALTKVYTPGHNYKGRKATLLNCDTICMQCPLLKSWTVNSNVIRLRFMFCDITDVALLPSCSSQTSASWHKHSQPYRLRPPFAGSGKSARNCKCLTMRPCYAHKVLLKNKYNASICFEE